MALLWKLLNSRKVALYLLLVLIGLLTASAFLPSFYTISPGEMHDLSLRKPAYYWVISHLSTPALVQSPLFSLVSLLLFLSTLACTCDRLRVRARSRKYQFPKEQAFSFSAGVRSALAPAALAEIVEQALARGRWQCSVQRDAAAMVISGEKGRSAFWGSIIFHIGLLCLFLCGPVTALTGFHGELAVLEREPVPLRGVVTTGGAASLPDVDVTAHDLKAEYFQGTFRENFGGVLTIGKDGAQREYPFAVNEPIDYAGYQMALQEFGYAPRLVIQEPGGTVTDTFLRVSSSAEKNRFEIGPGLSALVIFFPDFFREGERIGSRSQTLRNPVTMVKLFRGPELVYKGLFKAGESAVWEGKRISIPECRRWMSLLVTREWGIVMVLVGSALGVLGLFVRFLANERCIEFEVESQAEGSRARLRGYSRFYPAFLEREVLMLATRLGELEGAGPGQEQG